MIVAGIMIAFGFFIFNIFLTVLGTIAVTAVAVKDYKKESGRS